MCLGLVLRGKVMGPESANSQGGAISHQFGKEEMQKCKPPCVTVRWRIGKRWRGLKGGKSQSEATFQQGGGRLSHFA